MDTAEIRRAYIAEPEDAQIFDRWLEAHDRVVAAKAWDEGYSHCFDCPEPGTSLNDNPYRPIPTTDTGKADKSKGLITARSSREARHAVIGSAVRRSRLLLERVFGPAERAAASAFIDRSSAHALVSDQQVWVMFDHVGMSEEVAKEAYALAEEESLTTVHSFQAAAERIARLWVWTGSIQRSDPTRIPLHQRRGISIPLSILDETHVFKETDR